MERQRIIEFLDEIQQMNPALVGGTDRFLMAYIILELGEIKKILEGGNHG